MTRIFLAVASFICLAAWYPLCGFSAEGDDVSAARAVSKAIIAADNAGDLAAVSDLYEDDAVWLPPNGPTVEGKTSILGRYKTSFDQVNLQYSEESVETQMGGDWAFERGFVRGTATPKDGSAPRKTFDKYIMILHRGTDRRWRIARLMWNPAASMPAT
jgi:uncharacterized protein (TIGR02246 family)